MLNFVAIIPTALHITGTSWLRWQRYALGLIFLCWDLCFSQGGRSFNTRRHLKIKNSFIFCCNKLKHIINKKNDFNKEDFQYPIHSEPIPESHLCPGDALCKEKWVNIDPTPSFKCTFAIFHISPHSSFCSVAPIFFHVRLSQKTFGQQIKKMIFKGHPWGQRTQQTLPYLHV